MRLWPIRFGTLELIHGHIQVSIGSLASGRQFKKVVCHHMNGVRDDDFPSLGSLYRMPCRHNHSPANMDSRSANTDREPIVIVWNLKLISLQYPDCRHLGLFNGLGNRHGRRLSQPREPARPYKKNESNENRPFISHPYPQRFRMARIARHHTHFSNRLTLSRLFNKSTGM